MSGVSRTALSPQIPLILSEAENLERNPSEASAVKSINWFDRSYAPRPWWRICSLCPRLISDFRFLYTRGLELLLHRFRLVLFFSFFGMLKVACFICTSIDFFCMRELPLHFPVLWNIVAPISLLLDHMFLSDARQVAKPFIRKITLILFFLWLR